MLALLVLALVLAALALVADQRSRADESRALEACRRSLHDAAVSADLQMLAVATTTHGPLSSPHGSSLGLAGLMSRSAVQLLPDVVDADRVCRRVTVRPWHFSLRSRRNAATAYSGALVAKLRAVVANGRTSYVGDRTLRGLRGDADLAEFGGGS
jgi:hypothetical protein